MDSRKPFSKIRSESAHTRRGPVRGIHHQFQGDLSADIIQTTYLRGVIKKLDDQKSIGFITPTSVLPSCYNLKKDIFFHFNNLKIPRDQVSVDSPVSFKLNTKGDNAYTKPAASIVCQPDGVSMGTNLNRKRSGSVHSLPDHNDSHRGRHGSRDRRGSCQSLTNLVKHSTQNQRGLIQSHNDPSTSWQLGTIVNVAGQLKIDPSEGACGRMLPFRYNQVRGPRVHVNDQVRFKVDEQENVQVVCQLKDDVKRVLEEPAVDTFDDSADEAVRQRAYQKRSKVNSGSKIDALSTRADIGLYGTSSTGAYLTGQIKNVCEKCAFIKPSTKLPDGYNSDRDVFLNTEQVRSAGLRLVVGDMVRFSLGTKDKTRPMAIHSVVLKFRQRREQDVVAYVGYATERLQACEYDMNEDGMEERTKDEQSKTAFLVELINCVAIWKCLGDLQMLSCETAMAIVEFALFVETFCKGMRQMFRTVLIGLMESRLFNAWSGHMKHIIRDTWVEGHQDEMQLFQKFFQLVFKYTPEKSRSVVPLVKQMVNTSVKPLTQEAFLFSALKEICKLSGNSTTDMEWDDVPLVPTHEELLTSPDVDYMLLSPVTNTYHSPEEYLDTYFRLLRADCFDALRKGIKALIRGTLDARDMNVYVKVAIAGFHMTKRDTGLMITLKVTPQKAVRNWKTCSNLMYGNLICLSPSGNFHDVIWATVSSRDADLLNKRQWIVIELCTTSNSMSDSAAVVLLAHSSGHIVMVESPAYYRAYQPVLQAIQVCQPDELPFMDQLMGRSGDHKIPQYIEHEQATLETARQKASQSLDMYQLKAWDHAFQNELACIQGPPGTGKTFIGIKIVQTLIDMTNRPKSPILVITFKNHALDEFLKEIIKIPLIHVARVGGKSSEPELNAYNIQALSRNHPRSRAISTGIAEVLREMDIVKEAVEGAVTRLAKSRYVTLQTLMYSLNPVQLQSLIQGGKQKSKDTPKTCQALIQGTASPSDRKILFDAYQNWCPVQSIVAQVEDGYYKAMSSELEILPNASEHDEDTDEPNLLDEKDIEDMENERNAAGDHKKISQNEMIMFCFENQLKPEVKLFSIAKIFVSQLPYMRLMNTKDLWSLNDNDRIKFLQCVLVRQATECSEDLECQLQQYEMVCAQKNELDNQHKADVLKAIDVVGMTVTGANINHTLLAQIKPAIVIVEEAGEVLEAQLIAILGKWVQHLILIGDHKQLRPKVESYVLQNQYHFDLSMMERLIRSGIHYTTLNLQNRMLPEIADLLLDIYPDLESNITRVTKRAKSRSVVKSMFFWTHGKEEIGGRSYHNDYEAKCALNLALYFVQQGHQAHNVTILAAYQGQVALLRRLLQEAVAKWPSLLPVDQVSDKRPNHFKIHTIDLYQGDENEIVIVSLVRSNKQKKLGFLRLLNRRCVAQSRAQCGMYMIGNIDTLTVVDHWKSLVNKMSILGCVGDAIALQCKQHPNVTVLAQSADDIPLGKSFCKEPCNQLRDCKKHMCNELCQPPHNHDRCEVACCEMFLPCSHICHKGCFPIHDHTFCVERVDYTCGKCGNIGSKRCSDKEENISCQAEISFEFPCKHLGKKKCYEVKIQKCNHDCVKKLRCGHMCNEKCGDPCNDNFCKTCKAIRDMEERLKLESEKRQRLDAIDEAKREIALIQKAGEGSLEVTSILDVVDTAAEFDRICLFMVNGLPKPVDRELKVTEINKITFPMARSNWLFAKTRLFDPVQHDRKFLQATTDEIERIEQNEFDIKPSKGRYGKGCYVSSNLHEFGLTSDGKYHKALIVDALLGKVTKDYPLKAHPFLSELSNRNCDSIYTSNLATANRYFTDEFAVNLKEQLLPCYIVSYSISASAVHTVCNILELDALNGRNTEIVKHNLVPTREFKQDDVLELQLRLAESQFHRLNTVTNDNMFEKKGEFKLNSVDYYVNPKLLKRFSEKEKEMKEKYKNEKDGDYILAFHGTTKDNVETIVNENFDMSNAAKNTGDKGWYGAGIYLSEFPQTCLFYGEALILCRVLPGKSSDAAHKDIDLGGKLKPGYDSHRVNAHKEGYGEELVIFDPDQILPCYVINYTKLEKKNKGPKKKK